MPGKNEMKFEKMTATFLVAHPAHFWAPEPKSTMHPL
jgi:hypothetical protein